MTYKNTDYKNNFNSSKKSYTQQPIGNAVTVINGNVEQALRQFKKKVSNSGLLIEVREREYFEKPTSKRKLKKAAAIKREQKRLSLQPGSRGTKKY